MLAGIIGGEGWGRYLEGGNTVRIIGDLYIESEQGRRTGCEMSRKEETDSVFLVSDEGGVNSNSGASASLKSCDVGHFPPHSALVIGTGAHKEI